MRYGIAALGLGGLLSVGVIAGAAEVTVDAVLAVKPVITGVDIEDADPTKCKLQPVAKVAKSKASGYIALGPQGQILRKFMDSDGNDTVDEFRFFKDGLEVYREHDTNGSGKRDEFRWLNTGGTRWGVDRNENGTIDGWKMLSAEECSREVLRACATGNAEAIQALLVTEKELLALSVDKAFAAKVLDGLKDAPDKIKQAFADSKVVQESTQWLRFDSQMPHLIPAEAGRSQSDLHVYENVMAFVETAGKTGFVQIGEMIRVGEVWKLTRLPKPIEGDGPREIEAGWFISPSIPELAGIQGSGDLPEGMKVLFEELTKLDEQTKTFGDTPDPKVFAKFNQSRAEVLSRLADAAQKAGRTEDYQNYLRQQIDGTLAAIQMDAFPEGVQNLSGIEKNLESEPENPLLPYVMYRRMLADYSQKLKTPGNKKEDQDKAQVEWLQNLDTFIKKYPQAEDAPDALIQFGTTYDLMGKAKEAAAYYVKILKDYPASNAAKRATGAMRRLQLQGQPLTLNGQRMGGKDKEILDIAQYQGKVTLVVFWTTYCEPFNEDLPLMLDLHAKQKARGFEILGVNVDHSGTDLQGYMGLKKLTWENIQEVGGLEDSRLAVGYGILSLPTMFLVDKTGKVQAVTSSMSEVKKLLPELLK